MSAQNAVKRFEMEGPNGQGLSEWPVMDPASLASGTPVQTGHFYDEITAIDYSAGVWDCTAFDDRPGPYPVDEFMLLLDGSVDMEMPDGTQISVQAGEAFVIPKGLRCQWKMPGTVRKFFMILDGDAPGGSKNASLSRITKPDLHKTTAPQPGTITTRDTYFINHDGRMRVYIDSFGEAQNGPAPQTGRHLVYLLSGALSFPGHPELGFAKGDCFYLLPDNGMHWDISAGTRLLVSRCDVPS